jgi:alpha-beta hydrolase superfamily lysophospholipase
MVFLESIYSSRSGNKTYIAEYGLPDRPRGLVILVHGLGEHIRRYDEQFQYFVNKGYACLAADLPGHGRSEGRRGVWSSLEEPYAVIDRLFVIAGEKYPDIPRILYGHSMGANIAARYLQVRQPAIRAAILTGIAVSTPKDMPRPLVRAILGSPVWIKNLTIKNGLNIQSLCGDAQVVKNYLADPLVHDRVGLAAGASILDNAYLLTHTQWVPPCPVLVMHGEEDKITYASGSALLKSVWKINVDLKIWPGMMHEIHNETLKTQVWDYMLSWLDRLHKNNTDKLSK